MANCGGDALLAQDVVQHVGELVSGEVHLGLDGRQEDTWNGVVNCYNMCMGKLNTSRSVGLSDRMRRKRSKILC